MDTLVRWLDHHEGAGAWAGAAANALVAVVAVGVLLLQRYLERRSRRRSLGLAAHFKFRQIANDLAGLAKQLRLQKEEAEKQGLTEPWRYVRPLAHPMERMEFSSDEQEVLYGISSGPLFDALLLHSMFRNNAINLLKLYGERRTILLDMLPAEMAGSVGTTQFDESKMRVIAPRAAELNAMAQGMEQHFASDAETARKALAELTKAVRVKLQMNIPLKWVRD